MHTLALQLAPILAAEKSKVPFFIAGGLLVVWALVVSLGLGLRRPDFPGSQAGERLVIAISVVLVLVAVSTAVLTSSAPAPAGAQSGSQTSSAAAAPAPAPAPSGTPSTSATSQPVATTGAPTAPAPAKGGATSSLKLAANPSGQLSFEPKQLSAKAGKVTLVFTNASSVEHNLTIAQGPTSLVATPTFSGGSKTVTVTLKPGSYVFYCAVPGHRQAGMEGTLKVS